MRVAFLIPATSRGKDWRAIEGSYLYKYTLKSLKETLTDKHTYTIYLGVDEGDAIYGNAGGIDNIRTSLPDYCTIKVVDTTTFIRGHLTAIWNKLFKIAYDDGNDYFCQCGDDIEFQSRGWLDKLLLVLGKHDGIGVSGPVCLPNTSILTQTLVSRMHMKIFGCYFPEQIKNWFCDNWINLVYLPSRLYIQRDLTAVNKGGEPRYGRPDVRQYTHQRQLTMKLVKLGRKHLKVYIRKQDESNMAARHKNFKIL